MKERVGARVILFDQAGRVLLVAVTDPVDARRIWMTPGGGRDDGESDLDCARRELREETGVTVGELLGPVFVFAAWGRMRDGGNLRDIEEAQRRLRWALDVLPDRVRVAVPLVEQLANADWDGFFGVIEMNTRGRSVLSTLVALDDPPSEVMVTTAGLTLSLPD